MQLDMKFRFFFLIVEREHNLHNSNCFQEKIETMTMIEMKLKQRENAKREERKVWWIDSISIEKRIETYAENRVDDDGDNDDLLRLRLQFLFPH